MVVEKITLLAYQRTPTRGLFTLLFDQSLHILSIAAVLVFARGGLQPAAIATLFGFPVATRVLAITVGIITVTLGGSILAFEAANALAPGGSKGSLLRLDLARMVGMVERGGSIVLALAIGPAIGPAAFVPRVAWAMTLGEDQRRRQLAEAAAGLVLCAIVFLGIHAVTRSSRAGACRRRGHGHRGASARDTRGRMHAGLDEGGGTMSGTRTLRRHAGILPWLRALAFGATALASLMALPFYPLPVAAGLALAVALAGRFMPELGVLAVVIALAVPLAAANLVAGALFLVIGVSTIQYLTERQSRVYLVLALAFLGTLAGVPWAVVAAAGLLMGASEGAVAALFACLVIELAGIVVGKAAFGVVGTAGNHPGVVDTAYLRTIVSPLTFGWLGAAFARIDINGFLASVVGVKDLVTLVGQPVVWAVGAAVTGFVVRPVGDPRRPVTALAGAAAGVAVLVAGTIALGALAGSHIQITTVAVSGALSLVAAAGVAALSEWVFTPSNVESEKPVRPTHMSTEDADVDDLLRMISSAEEELASKHTGMRTVLMTDMKSFSQMTQDLGSQETAKRVQRHRDLLLPIVEGHGGKGKSTGGDGLLAAFDSPPSALVAAVEMQRTLDAYNRSRPGEEPILVRIGVAEGEAVLDRGGKPFLGDALNLAARIMSLADGEQVFTSRGVFERGGQLPYGGVDHGEFRLKNISAPVDVVEVLWAEGQLARAPLEENPEI